MMGCQCVSDSGLSMWFNGGCLWAVSVVWNCPPLGFGGGWGPPRSPWPGVSVSLCLSVSLTLVSQSCPCVSVFAEPPHLGARLLRGGGRSRFPQLLDSKGLFSPAGSTSSTPPSSALLTALASARPHFHQPLRVPSVGALHCGSDAALWGASLRFPGSLGPGS